MSIKATKSFIFTDLQGILSFASRNFLSSFLVPFHTCIHTYIQTYFNTQTNLWWRYYYFQHFVEKDTEAHSNTVFEVSQLKVTSCVYPEPCSWPTCHVNIKFNVSIGNATSWFVEQLIENLVSYLLSHKSK